MIRSRAAMVAAGMRWVCAAHYLPFGEGCRGLFGRAAVNSDVKSCAVDSARSNVFVAFPFPGGSGLTCGGVLDVEPPALNTKH